MGCAPVASGADAGRCSAAARPVAAESLRRLADRAIGLDVCYETVTGARTRRIYLDSTASTLRLRLVQDVLDRYLPHYSNTHSTLHFAARLSTVEYEWAHRAVLDFVDADPSAHMCFFTGSGTTSGMNRVARTLRAARPERDVVITSIMEHHSNDLPHRKHFERVIHVPAEETATSLGRIDLASIERALVAHPGRVSYVAITGVSNVTGIVNPIHDVAEIAHSHGALIVVDAAQMAAHLPIAMCGDDAGDGALDVVVFSGHKVYAPGSPGVVIARKDVFSAVEPDEVGGGMVERVWTNRYTVSSRFPDREEAGTPNIPGAIGLAAVLHALKRIGMREVAAEEHRLISYALERLADVPGVIVYGDLDMTRCPRAGAIAFNLEGLDHSFTAAVLNDYFNISVRNECFCAHPYVREMVLKALEGLEELDGMNNDELERMADLHRGMVRASLGIYSTAADIDALVAALGDIVGNQESLLREYVREDSGDYVHRRFRFDSKRILSVSDEVERFLG